MVSPFHTCVPYTFMESRFCALHGSMLVGQEVLTSLGLMGKQTVHQERINV